MEFSHKNLPNAPELLKKIILQQQSKLLHLEEQFRLAQQKQFGKSAEGHPGQGELFNEAEVAAEKLEPDEACQNVDLAREKPKRKPLPADLPREVVTHDISAADKICDCSGGDLHQMGEEKSDKLEFIPAQERACCKKYLEVKFGREGTGSS